MRGKYKFSSVMTGIVVLTFIVFVTLMMIVISQATRSAYEVEKKAIHEEVVRFERAQLETEANEIVDYIRLSEEKASEAMRIELKRRVDEAYNIAENIYKGHGHNRDEAVVERMIIESLRGIRYDDGAGYLFMDRFDGEVLLYPIMAEFEGSNVLDLKDDYGNFVIRDEINIARTFGEGYAEGHWIKPNQPGSKGSLKVSYIRRFRDKDWYIGTGIYEEDYLQSVKNSVIEDISAFKAARVSGHKYFISTLNGELLLCSEGLVESSQWLDNESVMLAGQAPQGEFLEEAIVGDEDTTRITYVKPIDTWKWIVGFEAQVSENVSESKAYYLKGMLHNFNRMAVLLGLGVLVFFGLFMSLFNRRLDDCFNRLGTVMSTSGREGVEGEFCFKEFENLILQVDKNRAASSKATDAMVSQPQFDAKPIETIVEGEAIAVGLIQNLNSIIRSNQVDKMTEIKLSQIGAGMTSIRKLLTRMSHHEETAANSEKVLNLEYISLKSHLKQIMELIVHEYTDTKVDVRVICDKDLVVYSDPMIFSQVISHLATNSINHGFDEGASGIITIEVIYDEEYLRIYFSDNGRGMTQYVQERIFEPYYTTSAMKGDVGLGLSEVFSLVHDTLGGAINCSSRVGFGTDFFIDIPGIGPGLWLDDPNASEQSS